MLRKRILLGHGTCPQSPVILVDGGRPLWLIARLCQSQWHHSRQFLQVHDKMKFNLYKIWSQLFFDVDVPTNLVVCSERRNRPARRCPDLISNATLNDNTEEIMASTPSLMCHFVHWTTFVYPYLPNNHEIKDMSLKPSKHDVSAVLERVLNGETAATENVRPGPAPVDDVVVEDSDGDSSSSSSSSSSDSQDKRPAKVAKEKAAAKAVKPAEKTKREPQTKGKASTSAVPSEVKATATSSSSGMKRGDSDCF